MERLAQRFASFEEADAADRDYYLRLRSSERLAILKSLVFPSGGSDLKALLQILNQNSVEYVVVGGYALAYHDRPRYTADLDLVVRASLENGERVANALREFGFGSLGLAGTDFDSTGRVVQIGHAPNRVDLLTSIDGVEFDQIWRERENGEIDGVPVFFLSRSLLIRNKRAAGRPRDRADLAELGEE